MLIALTGGIGSGKSTVAEIWRSLGATIVDADELAREVVAPDTQVLKKLVREFGTELIDSAGALRRDVLARMIFAHPEVRKRVESLMHPAIQALAAARIAGATSPVVYVIPLLAETVTPLQFDAVVNISVPEEVRLTRLIESRGMSREEAELRIAAQASESERARLADHQLDANCTLDELRVRATQLFESIVTGGV